MLMLPTPPYVEGGKWVFDPTCYAAALSSWQGVTTGRTRETKQQIEDRLKANNPSPLMKTAHGDALTLDASKFDVFAKARNIAMAWRPISGEDFAKFDFELTLEITGYLYVVLKVGAGRDGAAVSHARVLYGAWNEMNVAYFMDPALGDTSMEKSEIKKGKFMVGVARERLPGWMNGWQNVEAS